jgi:hypothetical protein
VVCFVSRSSNQTVSFITYQNLGREATMSTGQADLNMLKVIVVEIGSHGFCMFGYHLVKFVMFLDMQSSAQN